MVSERLRSIESCLGNARVSSGLATNASPSALPSIQPQYSFEPKPLYHQRLHVSNAVHYSSSTSSYPFDEVKESYEGVEAELKSLGGVESCRTDRIGGASARVGVGLPKPVAGTPLPDAIIRGVMTDEECEASFQM